MDDDAVPVYLGAWEERAGDAEGRQFVHPTTTQRTPHDTQRHTRTVRTVTVLRPVSQRTQDGTRDEHVQSLPLLTSNVCLSRCVFAVNSVRTRGYKMVRISDNAETRATTQHTPMIEISCGMEETVD